MYYTHDTQCSRIFPKVVYICSTTFWSHQFKNQRTEEILRIPFFTYLIFLLTGPAEPQGHRDNVPVLFENLFSKSRKMSRFFLILWSKFPVLLKAFRRACSKCMLHFWPEKINLYFLCGKSEKTFGKLSYYHILI